MSLEIMCPQPICEIVNEYDFVTCFDKPTYVFAWLEEVKQLT